MVRCTADLGRASLPTAGRRLPVLVPFVFNRTQSYVLAIGDPAGSLSMQTVGVLNDPVAPATVGTPYWFGAGVWNSPPRRADGTSGSPTRSRATRCSCAMPMGLPLMAIVRHGHNDWSIAPYELFPASRPEWNHGPAFPLQRNSPMEQPLPMASNPYDRRTIQ